MKNKLILILVAFLTLVSCEYDYIHENPKHPYEYIGIWECDSIYVNGNLKEFPFAGIDIFQETFEFGDISCARWEVKKDSNIPQLIGMDVTNTNLIVLDIIKTPTLGKMELKSTDTVYYLTKIR